MQLEEKLGVFGLTEKEAAVYLALLHHNSAKPAALARRLNLSRPTVYDTLRKLQQKGLVYISPGKATQNFTAKDPRTLTKIIDDELHEQTTRAEQKKMQLEQLMPNLLSIAKEAGNLPRVKYFEGLSGIEDALKETLNTKDIIRAYADIESITKTMGEKFTKYLAQRVKKNIHARAIAPDTKEWRQRAMLGQKELRDVRFLPVGAEYSPEINIFDNNVLMISWKESFALLITSKDFANAQRVIYDELWSRLSS